jgi:hypothetical protein
MCARTRIVAKATFLSNHRFQIAGQRPLAEHHVGVQQIAPGKDGPLNSIVNVGIALGKRWNTIAGVRFILCV